MIVVNKTKFYKLKIPCLLKDMEYIIQRCKNDNLDQEVRY